MQTRLQQEKKRKRMEDLDKLLEEEEDRKVEKIRRPKEDPFSLDNLLKEAKIENKKKKKKKKEEEEIRSPLKPQVEVVLEEEEDDEKEEEENWKQWETQHVIKIAKATALTLGHKEGTEKYFTQMRKFIKDYYSSS
jgi:hypothetical protein